MKAQVVILAGGLATRLGKLTSKIPKLLVEVAGEPFFNHQLRLLKRAGLTKLVLCVGHLGEMIDDYYGDGSEWGMEIDYSFDGSTLLGTGGSIVKALPKLGDFFYVLYGDSYLRIDYQAVGKYFLESGKQGLMTIYKNQGLYDASNVWCESDQIIAYDKTIQLPQMQYIDYGLSIFNASAFANYSLLQPLDLAQIHSNLLERKELAAYKAQERFYEIGSLQGINELDFLLSTDASLS